MWGLFLKQDPLLAVVVRLFASIAQVRFGLFPFVPTQFEHYNAFQKVTRSIWLWEFFLPSSFCCPPFCMINTWASDPQTIGPGLAVVYFMAISPL